MICRRYIGLAGLLGALVLFAAGRALAEDIDPYPQAPAVGPVAVRWSFEKDLQGWRPVHDCQAKAAEGAMQIDCTGSDPYLIAKSPKAVPGPVLARARIRAKTGGSGQFFWASDRQPQIRPGQSVSFPLLDDGQWHECEALLDVAGSLVQLRLDPGTAPGRVEVAWIELCSARHYPLVIERMSTTPNAIGLALRNRSDDPVTVTCGGQNTAIESGKTVEVSLKAPGAEPFALVPLAVKVQGFGDLQRKVVVHRPADTGNWLACGAKEAPVRVLVAPDGSGAHILRDGKQVAVIAPLVMDDAGIVRFHVAGQQPGSLRLHAEGCEVSLAVAGDEVRIAIEAGRSVEGPVVRPLGALVQGLFAGLEYLGRGERSSSKLDIETDEHLRFAPDVLKVTLPLMACVTDQAAVALAWQDMTLQPTFACPNFVDGMPDEQRMSLRGARIEAVVRVSGGSVEEAIQWAVRRSGLPPVPAAPRDATAQTALNVAAIRGPIAGPGGWGHCAEEKWARQPFADVASALFWATGEVPQLDRLVPGGAHVRNDAIYFVSGRAKQWLELRRREVRGAIAAQKADGSFRYKGDYQRGHFEDTASGYCARPATTLLECARLTGDDEALQAGLKALEFMKRFQVPRGAQTWELSLHTPDVLASAYLVWAYVRGYELTGRAEYLAEARRWALSGIPFVYLWGRYPTMLYTTPPVYGATNYRSPNWIGLPVQWCGGVYAYALTLLAAHDATVDWRHLARGIYVAAQQVQYPDGPLAGCLPDIFVLTTQRRDGPSINPSAVLSLQLRLEGKLDALAVATDGKHRVTAPFPVEIRGGEAVIQGQAGLDYEVLIDGRVVEVKASRGRDLVPLAR